MKKSLLALSLAATLGFSESLYLANGWNNIGATHDIDLSSFDLSGCVDLIWKYSNNGHDTPKWLLYVSNKNKYDIPINVNYLSSIKEGDGLWVLATGSNEECEVTIKESKQHRPKPLFPGHSSGNFASYHAFAALKKDGGNSLGVKENLKDIEAVYSTKFAFAALNSDGSVVTWGDSTSLAHPSTHYI